MDVRNAISTKTAVSRPLIQRAVERALACSVRVRLQIPHKASAQPAIHVMD
jgi:hypothetical protein